MTIRQDYEYRGLIATTWDLLRGDTSGWPDRRFYLEVIARYGQPVLDIGCGTGRLILDYMSHRIDIDGVDNSPEMLAICREKAQRLGLTPRVCLQDMETLDLPRPYRTILVPSSSFQLVTDAAKAGEVIRRFFAHLEPGGALVMPFMTKWRPGGPLDTEWKVVREKIRPEDGATIRRQSRVRYDPANQLEHTEDIFEVLKDDVVVHSEHHGRSPALRWYTQDQAAALYRKAGFDDIRVLANFTFESASDADELFTIIGRKPAA